MIVIIGPVANNIFRRSGLPLSSTCYPLSLSCISQWVMLIVEKPLILPKSHHTYMHMVVGLTIWIGRGSMVFLCNCNCVVFEGCCVYDFLFILSLLIHCVPAVVTVFYLLIV